MSPRSRSHDHSSRTRPLAIALTITTVVLLAELIGAWISGSLALLSDAMHMLSDSAGLVLALIAVVVGKRRATAEASYGYRRAEVLAAVVNALLVIAATVWILVESVGRLIHGRGEQIDTTVMLIIAVVGLVANAASAAALHGHAEDSLNIRGAFLHVLTDLFGSVAVIVAALVIKTTGWQGIDAVASLIIVGLVLPRAAQLAWNAIGVLMERAPKGTDPRQVARDIEALDCVRALHDMHIWSTDGVTPLASCHVVSKCGDCDAEEDCHVLDKVQEVMRTHGIEHSTVQVETPSHEHHEDVHH